MGIDFRKPHAIGCHISLPEAVGVSILGLAKGIQPELYHRIQVTYECHLTDLCDFCEYHDRMVDLTYERNKGIGWDTQEDKPPRFSDDTVIRVKDLLAGD